MFIQENAFEKMLFAKWRQFCLGFNMFKQAIGQTWDVHNADVKLLE